MPSSETDAAVAAGTAEVSATIALRPLKRCRDELLLVSNHTQLENSENCRRLEVLHSRAGSTTSSNSGSATSSCCEKGLPLSEGDAEDDTMPETDDSSAYDDDDSSDDDDEDDEHHVDAAEDEAETRIAQALVRAAFTRGRSHHSSSTSSLSRLLYTSMLEQKQQQQRSRLDSATNSQGPHPAAKRLRRSLGTTPIRGSERLSEAIAISTSSSMPAAATMRSSLSAPLLVTEKTSSKNIKTQKEIPLSSAASEYAGTKPDDFLYQLLTASATGTATTTGPSQEQVSKKCATAIQYHAASSLSNFFKPLTKESIEAYDKDLTRAVNDEDVVTLQSLHQAGRTMHAGNKFGETIVHAACRRGSQAVLDFLLHQAQASIQVCCDAHRTPLHDACWTSHCPGPVIDLILDACPDLLYITDGRGFTPLQYVPQNRHADWCRYLARRGAERLQPQTLPLWPTTPKNDDAIGAKP